MLLELLVLYMKVKDSNSSSNLVQDIHLIHQRLLFSQFSLHVKHRSVLF